MSLYNFVAISSHYDYLTLIHHRLLEIVYTIHAIFAHLIFANHRANIPTNAAKEAANQPPIAIDRLPTPPVGCACVLEAPVDPAPPNPLMISPPSPLLVVVSAPELELAPEDTAISLTAPAVLVAGAVFVTAATETVAAEFVAPTTSAVWPAVFVVSLYVVPDTVSAGPFTARVVPDTTYWPLEFGVTMAPATVMLGAAVGTSARVVEPMTTDEPPGRIATGVPLTVMVEPPAERVVPPGRMNWDAEFAVRVEPPTMITGGVCAGTGAGGVVSATVWEPIITDEPPDRIATGVPLMVMVEPPAERVVPPGRTNWDAEFAVTVEPPTVITGGVCAGAGAGGVVSATVWEPIITDAPPGMMATGILLIVTVEPPASRVVPPGRTNWLAGFAVIVEPPTVITCGA